MNPRQARTRTSQAKAKAKAKLKASQVKLKASPRDGGSMQQQKKKKHTVCDDLAKDLQLCHLRLGLLYPQRRAKRPMERCWGDRGVAGEQCGDSWGVRSRVQNRRACEQASHSRVFGEFRCRGGGRVCVCVHVGGRWRAGTWGSECG
jgi:hypothetical protein